MLTFVSTNLRNDLSYLLSHHFIFLSVHVNYFPNLITNSFHLHYIMNLSCAANHLCRLQDSASHLPFKSFNCVVCHSGVHAQSQCCTNVVNHGISLVGIVVCLLCTANANTNANANATNANAKMPMLMTQCAA